MGKNQPFNYDLLSEFDPLLISSKWSADVKMRTLPLEFKVGYQESSTSYTPSSSRSSDSFNEVRSHQKDTCFLRKDKSRFNGARKYERKESPRKELERLYNHHQPGRDSKNLDLVPAEIESKLEGYKRDFGVTLGWPSDLNRLAKIEESRRDIREYVEKNPAKFEHFNKQLEAYYNLNKQVSHLFMSVLQVFRIFWHFSYELFY